MNKYSLKEIINTIIKNCLVIIILGIFFGGLFGLYARHKKTTTYEATRSMFVTHSISQTRGKSSQVMADQQMIPTYQDILKDQTIAKSARQYLPKSVRKDYSVEKISDAISSSSKDNSLVINVHAKADNAKDATYLVNAVTRSFKNELPKIDGQAGRVHLLSQAYVKDANSKTKPSIKKYAVLGAAFGILLGMVISFGITTWRKIL